MARISRCFISTSITSQGHYHRNKIHALTNVDSSGHLPAAAASVSETDVATKVALSTLSEGVNTATSSTSCSYWSLIPENGGVYPLAQSQKYTPPSDLCVNCKLTIDDACVVLAHTDASTHIVCYVSRATRLAGVGCGITPTSSNTKVDTSNFLYEHMSIENVLLLGPMPSVVYCMYYTRPTSREDDSGVQTMVVLSLVRSSCHQACIYSRCCIFVGLDSILPSRAAASTLSMYCAVIRELYDEER